LGFSIHQSIMSRSVANLADLLPERGNSLGWIGEPRTPPETRITLRFALTDRAGTVVRGGERTPVDPLFLTRTSLDQHDPLRHETALLDAWLDREVAGLR
jgi:hypothetical protein